jgi:signal transduction histidine kinase
MDDRSYRASEARDDELRELIERKRLLVGLVDDLLEDVKLRPRVVDLRDIARDALQVTERAIRARAHDVRLDLPGYPVNIDGDSMRLFQAISNLLDNALRYTAPGGNLSVRVWAEGDEARVSVSDDGQGFAPEQLERIFVSLHGTASDGEDGATGGLGIGLMLVRRFVELHGGVVEVASAGPQKGSRFTIRLPAHMRAQG